MKKENLELFLAQIRIKGSEKTVQDYKRHIEKFFTKCNKEDKDVEYADLLSYYNTEFTGVKINSKRTYMASILSYFKFLYEQDKIPNNIVKSFKLPKAEVKDMEYLNEEEALKIAKICDREKVNRLRKKAMFIMFINSGMRISELANIKLTDIKDGWINVENAKGNKFRQIPLHPSVKKAIDDYIKQERKGDSPYLFINKCGNQLTCVNVNRDLNGLLAKTNINKHISAHRLRDSFATIQYINGSDLKTIQETLGHQSIQMTLHYVQKVDEKRRQQVLCSGVKF